MTPVVAIVAQGTMGAGLATVLTSHQVTVLTNLEGRSAASVTRAALAGMQACPWERLVEADIFLSVLPPGEAVAVAEQFCAVLGGARPPALYVDCNAVSPATVRTIESLIKANGARFADVGIIGLPPGPTGPPPRLYASGEDAAILATLGPYGIDIRVLEGPAGNASALKMSYAGITKGLIAVAGTMMLGASRAGVAGPLAAELQASQAALFAILSDSVPRMPSRAYRWIAEMKEISEFLGGDDGGRALYAAAARVYDQLDADRRGTGDMGRRLTEFFDR